MNPDVRILQLTDPHLFASAQGRLRGMQTLESLQQVLAHARARKLTVDAVLCTGDVVNDEPEGYAHFSKELLAFGKPVYCVPGNHDDVTQMHAALGASGFQVGGHVDLGAWRLVLIDSCVPGKAGGRISDQELRSLDEALHSTERYAMVCMHHHPVEMASGWLDKVGIENAADFFDVLDSHPQVRVISWGHVHQCFDARRRGVRLLATPSTGAQFLPLSNEFAVDSRPPAYRRLTLRSDGTIDTDVVWVAAAADTFGSAAGRSA
jgi:3',5'-cyclic-AMP phosphodiesterase